MFKWLKFGVERVTILYFTIGDHTSTITKDVLVFGIDYEGNSSSFHIDVLEPIL